MTTEQTKTRHAYSTDRPTSNGRRFRDWIKTQTASPDGLIRALALVVKRHGWPTVLWALHDSPDKRLVRALSQSAPRVPSRARPARRGVRSLVVVVTFS